MAQNSSEYVLNHDVAGLIARLNRFREELYKSVSSGIGGMNSFDQARLVQYLTAARTFIAWVVSQPQLDLPESHPKQWILENDPVIENVENEDVNMLLNLLGLAVEELKNSQSGRLPAGLLGFDESRVQALLTKADNFLTNYIQIATPLDLPESSPQEVLSGPGKKGV